MRLFKVLILCSVVALSCGVIWVGQDDAVHAAPIVCFNFNAAADPQIDDCGADDDGTFLSVQPAYSSTGGPIDNDGKYTWDGATAGQELQVSDSARFDQITTNDAFTMSIHLKSGNCGANGSTTIGKAGEFSWLKGLSGNEFSPAVTGPTGGTNVVIDGTPSVCDNTWHHVAFVWDGSIGRRAIYVDGAIHESEDFSDWTGSISAGAIDLKIGQRIASNAYAGELDNFRLYDYAQVTGDTGTPNTIAYDNATAVPD